MDPVKLAKFIWLFVLLQLIAIELHGQKLSTARSEGLGGAGVTLSGIESAIHNPAVGTNGASGIMATSFMPFATPGLSSATILGTHQLSTDQWMSASLSNYGTGAYRHTSLRLGYARSVLPHLNISIEFAGGIEEFEGYGRSASIGYAIGLFHRISDKLALAARIADPIPIPVRIPASPEFVIGLRYSPMKSVALYCDIGKEGFYKMRLKTGIEHTVFDVITLRCGISTNPSKFHFGTAVNCTRRINVAMAMSYHLTLGFSPSIDITFTPEWKSSSSQQPPLK